MNETKPRAVESPSDPPGSTKKPYSPPQLAVFGDVRDVTMGVSPGVGESGNPVIFRI
ncbi:MAG: lasso RiPP family leader peptide-containing protein [Thermoanaerobaculia bacterium]|nr:lasso RiPP family leader peptide-containing protein [Thermoanaerobaculia bacterium]